MLQFNKNISVILPLEDNDKQPISYDSILKPLGVAYGGYTLFNSVSGVWYDKGVKYEDKSQILRVDYQEMDNDQEKSLINLFEFLFQTQYALMIMIDNKSLFIDQGNKKEFYEQLKTL